MIAIYKSLLFQEKKKHFTGVRIIFKKTAVHIPDLRLTLNKKWIRNKKWTLTHLFPPLQHLLSERLRLSA